MWPWRPYLHEHNIILKKYYQSKNIIECSREVCIGVTTIDESQRHYMSPQHDEKLKT